MVAKCTAPNLNPLAKPFNPLAGSSTAAQPPKVTTVANDWPKLPVLGKINPEPSFDSLLYLEQSQGGRPLPEDRPEKVTVFLDRDAAYYSEVRKLSKAVIIDGGGHTPALPPEEVVRIAVETGLVREEEIRVALLARGRTLIHLSRGLKVDTFIRALPASLWDMGYNIQPWSENGGGEMIMPRFKVLVELVDFPEQMWRENEVKKAISGMGLYLGTVPSEKQADLSSWRLALATNDLCKVAKTMGIVIGGMEHVVQIRPIIWETGAVYKPEDFPVEPIRYSRPTTPNMAHGEASDTDTSSASHDTADLDVVHCSRRALQEIYLSIKPDLISPEIMAVILGGNNSAAVPFHILKDMVLTDDHARPQFSNKPPTASDVADRKKHWERVAAQRAARKEYTESIVPDLSLLFQEDQHQNVSLPCAQEATTKHSEIPQLSAATQQGLIIQDKDHDGSRETRRAEPKEILGHNLHNNREDMGGVQQSRPQTIRPRSILSRTQGKKPLSHPACASRHTRFALQVGQGKGKAKMGSDLPTRKKGVTSQLTISEDPQDRPHGKQRKQNITAGASDGGKSGRGQKKVLQEGTALVTVLIQLQTGRISGPSPQEAHPPSKRKPATQLPRPRGDNKKKPTKAAQLHLNPEGYYTVQVNKFLCRKIGLDCGLTAQEIEKALVEDNQAREADASGSKATGLEEDMEWGDHTVISESDEDLLSDPEI